MLESSYKQFFRSQTQDMAAKKTPKKNEKRNHVGFTGS